MEISEQMHETKFITAGAAPGTFSKVLIMLHGRGATAEGILSLAPYLHVDGYSIIAPQATGNTWYPHSFLAPQRDNEPWLGSALQVLRNVIEQQTSNGIAQKDIYLMGFSQGACLVLEYAARNAGRYGGIVAFTGGLIGDRLNKENYMGDFERTPVFLGTSDPDPHVPVERVFATGGVLSGLNADVKDKVYRHMGHTINQDEINLANKYVFGA